MAAALGIPRCPSLRSGRWRRMTIATLGMKRSRTTPVLQPGGELDLLFEPLGTEGGGELGVKHLQRDRAVVLEIVGEVHGCHPAAAQLTLDAVAVGERDRQAVLTRVRHAANYAAGPPG